MLEPQLDHDFSFSEGDRKVRSKTSERISYEAEVDIIREQIGDLEDIRFRLGLSARKMSQLLMVDPSAWTRWTKRITPPPPHIYRALQWYMILQEKNPGFTPQVFLASHWHSRSKQSAADHEALSSEFEKLVERLENLEATKQKNHQRLKWPFGGRVIWFILGGIAGVLIRGLF